MDQAGIGCAYAAVKVAYAGKRGGTPPESIRSSAPESQTATSSLSNAASAAIWQISPPNHHTRL